MRDVILVVIVKKESQNIPLCHLTQYCTKPPRKLSRLPLWVFVRLHKSHTNHV